MTIEDIYKIFQQNPNIQTDTRKLKKNDLFFALKGSSFNGNDYAQQALEKGAAYVIVDEKLSFKDERVIQTNDVLKSLQDLAKFHRLCLDNSSDNKKISFIAITGSNGKTTTKELLSKVLASKFVTYTTEGNLNNHIGVPITILKIRDDAEMAIIEMGANHLQEIAGYCKYAMPTHGLITNCGKAHLEGFGSMDNIKKGKGELFDYLREHRGTAFVNSDDNAVAKLSTGINNVIFYGSNSKDINVSIVQSDPFLTVKIFDTVSWSIKTNLVGSYNFSNVLAAICIGRYFNIEDNKIKEAIENYIPSNSRSQLLKYNSNTIISDTYNANPSSMKVAIENFAAMKAQKKILLLGSMMELGTESKNEHASIISIIDGYNWEAVVLVGNNFKEIEHKYINYDNALQVKEWLHRLHPEKAHILIKGSRSMQMEKVLE